MGDKTKIEWADATISPLYGCSKVSPACANCYAERLAARFSKNPATAALYAGTVDDAGHWTGRLNLLPHRMQQALRWKRPRRIFIASQSDLFHENAPEEFLDLAFAYMAVARQHTFLLLTKRAERLRSCISGADVQGRVMHAAFSCIPVDEESLDARSFATWPLPNVHIGVTVENQEQANARIPLLLETPAALRFVSIEPMLGPVSLREYYREEGRGTYSVWLDYLDHVICGGESGPNARPMHPGWVRSLRDQCAGAEVPFMFKQWGEWAPHTKDVENECGEIQTTPRNRSGVNWHSFDGVSGVFRVGRAKAGRLLDGVEHLEMPEVPNA